MRRRNFPRGTSTAAAFLATKSHPEGYYVTRASTGADILRSGLRLTEPWASAKIGPRKSAKRWPTLHGLVIIGGVSIRADLLSAVESATGPLRWGLSVDPVSLSAEDAAIVRVPQSHFVAGFLRGKMVAVAAPIAPGMP